ncbi:MAG: hypothetical protein IT288_14675 [Bdellovibrionales bacterium]|nr:hypothetical protein [Bdellovibrionales bacterium]
MRYLKLLSIVPIFVVALNSEARSFYKATFKINVQYANIVDGTVDLLSELKVKLRYSDDHDFCEVVVGDAAFKCHSYHPDDHPENVMVTMDRGVGAQIVATALNQNKCVPGIQASFARLATYLDDTIDVEWQGDDFYQQIHDDKPESFHVWFYDMTQGVKY